jgi:hypothetical protein
MDPKAIATDIEQALHTTRSWAETGWPMTFGKQLRPVHSLAAASALEESFVYRLEAVSYWRRAQEAGGEVATWGERALAAVLKGDLQDADDSLYFAMYLERPLRGEAPVWGPVYRKFKQQVCG